MTTHNRGVETEKDEVKLVEAIQFAHAEWKWLVLGALFGLLAAEAALSITPKKNISKAQIQLSTSTSTTSIINTFKDAKNLPLKIQDECGLGLSTPLLTQNRILVKPTPNKLTTISIEAQIYLPLDSKKCVQSIADHIHHQDQSELEKLSRPLENKITNANKNILEINNLIAQINHDTTGNSIAIKAILLQPLLFYQDQILQIQTAIKELKSSPFTMGSIENQPQPYSKHIAILAIGALAGLAIGAGIRWSMKRFVE